MLVSLYIHIRFSIPSCISYLPFRIIFSFLKNILYKFLRWLSDSSKLCLFSSVWTCPYVVLVLKISFARCIILPAFWRLQRKADGQGICTREYTPGLLEQHSMGKLSRENISNRCAMPLPQHLATGSGFRLQKKLGTCGVDTVMEPWLVMSSSAFVAVSSPHPFPSLIGACLSLVLEFVWCGWEPPILPVAWLRHWSPSLVVNQDCFI